MRQRKGFVRVRVDGEVWRAVDDDIHLDKNKKHNIDVMVDRLIVARWHPRAAGGFSGDGDGACQTAWQSSCRVDSEECCFHRTMPARIAASALRSCRRACSRSTLPLAHARTCAGLGYLAKVGSPSRWFCRIAFAVPRTRARSTPWAGVQRIVGGSMAMMYLYGAGRITMDSASLDTPFEKLPQKQRWTSFLYGTRTGTHPRAPTPREYGNGNVLHAVRGCDSKSGAPLSGDDVRNATKAELRVACMSNVVCPGLRAASA